MNEKEISELRRRFTTEKSNISRVRGCFVNEKHEIVSEFSESLGFMPEAESDEILAVMKKTLSGAVGKNLMEMEFSARQVLESPEHKLLTDLRASELSEDALVKELFGKIASSVMVEGSFLILTASDKYDVPFYAKDGGKDENTNSTFSYFITCICPVKETKTTLGYHAHDSKFCISGADAVVSSPVLGFVFPAYEDRSANIYKALYYTKSASERQEAFVKALFDMDYPMPAEEQKETFRSVISEAVAESCDLDVMKNLHNEFTEIIKEHKEQRQVEPLTVNGETVKDVLLSSGIDSEHLESFEKQYKSEFGEYAAIRPQNLLDIGHFDVTTPDVSVRVNPERLELVETRIIDGVKYILIQAGEGVEVNGIPIAINE